MSMEELIEKVADLEYLLGKERSKVISKERQIARLQDEIGSLKDQLKQGLDFLRSVCRTAIPHNQIGGQS